MSFTKGEGSHQTYPPPLSLMMDFMQVEKEKKGFLQNDLHPLGLPLSGQHSPMSQGLQPMLGLHQKTSTRLSKGPLMGYSLSLVSVSLLSSPLSDSFTLPPSLACPSFSFPCSPPPVLWLHLLPPMVPNSASLCFSFLVPSSSCFLHHFLPASSSDPSPSALKPSCCPCLP